MLDHAIFTKADHWKYEQEWRLIKYRQGAGVYKTSPEALVGIILGAQISDEDRRDVLKWISSCSQPVNVYQSTVSPTQFAVEINEIHV
jgi:hypothetical protein